MASAAPARGLIAVDKMGGKVLFLNPTTFATEVVLEGFPRTVHELLVVPETSLAYVPIFGDGIHGRNPNPQHLLCIIDLAKRTHVGDIDLRPYIAPHTLRLGSDGLIYITCENSAAVAVIDRATHKVIDAIDSGSTNGHRLVISPDGRRLYTENEEDGTVSVIDLANRKLLGKIKTPRALAGIALSADGRTVVAVDDEEPTLFLIDTKSESVADTIRLKDVAEAAQIARYSPDDSLLCVTSLKSDTVSLIDASFREQTAIKVGRQPMDMAFRGDELFVACQGDGSVHVIDIPARRAKHSFGAGTGCESLGFF
ncbi:MAG TPA: cytochrome D1 domain-containing protein [Xanthobacteraceae bacterium]|jgi:YVTN family beta-propeller protein|nr:cytochrome D1 domain-containing protein [Xanthobacteraceae bacterium]